MSTKTAGVTGATGLVGKHVVDNLVALGIRVKCLSRKLKTDPRTNVQYVVGDICDQIALGEFVEGCDYLFHCAGELYTDSDMYRVNVDGTRNILKAVKASKISYLCYLSSAGVTGNSKDSWVDEKASSDPQNEYERTKKQGEDLICYSNLPLPVVVLRPVNVMDFSRLGVFSLPVENSMSSRIQLLIKGNQLAHQVHAEDVARAAIHLMSISFPKPEIFVVGNDENPLNTYGGIWNIVAAIPRSDSKNTRLYFPIWLGNFMRYLSGSSVRYRSNKYTSKKLINSGFAFKWSLESIAKHIVANHLPLKSDKP